MEAKVIKGIRGWSTDDSFMVAEIIVNDHSEMAEGGKERQGAKGAGILRGEGVEQQGARVLAMWYERSGEKQPPLRGLQRKQWPQREPHLVRQEGEANMAIQEASLFLEENLCWPPSQE